MHGHWLPNLAIPPISAIGRNLRRTLHRVDIIGFGTAFKYTSSTLSLQRPRNTKIGVQAIPLNGLAAI
jgi:hypothetical protein